MSQLISGKEAKLLLAQENEVQYLDTRGAFKTLGWCDANDLTGCQFSMKHYQFRLKPRTITINGMDLPAPFDSSLKHKQYAYVLNTVSPDGYSSMKFYEGGSQPLMCWTDEEEIKQVVAASLKVFKGG